MSTHISTTLVHRETAGYSEPATIGYVKSEFATLDRHLKVQFASQFQYQKDVTAQLTSSIDEVSRRLDNLAKETERRFDGLLSLRRTRLAIRAFHHIWPLPTADGRTPRFFPETIAMFWKLKDPKRRLQLASLLQSYRYYDFEVWGKYNDLGERIERTQLEIIYGDMSPLEHYVNLYPEKAHSTLADILGLEYDNVRREMEALQRYSAKNETGSKRGNDMEEETYPSQSSKHPRMTISDNSSLTEEIHRGEPGDYKQTRLSSTPDSNAQGTSELSAPDTSSGED